jgi:lipoate-protein ligase B
MVSSIEVIHLSGLVPYEEALERQMQRRLDVEAGQAGNALFLLEHRPVFTFGRNFQPTSLLHSEQELRARGFDVVAVDRGGDVTYHGPGQLVAYPILDLHLWKLSIQWYLRALESVLIAQLERYGLSAERRPGYTGVWVADAKVAAIGIGLHNWVTYHGIALNVSNDLSPFRLIVPCGIAHLPVASLTQLLPTPPTVTDAMTDFARAFLDHFTTSTALSETGAQ